MARIKGSPKTGGRKKGVGNRRSKELSEALEAINFRLSEKIVEILPHLDEKDQMTALLKLAEFIYPKPKFQINTEITSDQMSWTEVMNLLDI